MSDEIQFRTTNDTCQYKLRRNAIKPPGHYSIRNCDRKWMEDYYIHPFHFRPHQRSPSPSSSSSPQTSNTYKHPPNNVLASETKTHSVRSSCSDISTIFFDVENSNQTYRELLAEDIIDNQIVNSKWDDFNRVEAHAHKLYQSLDYCLASSIHKDDFSQLYIMMAKGAKHNDLENHDLYLFVMHLLNKSFFTFGVEECRKNLCVLIITMLVDACMCPMTKENNELGISLGHLGCVLKVLASRDRRKRNPVDGDYTDSLVFCLNKLSVSPEVQIFSIVREVAKNLSKRNNIIITAQDITTFLDDIWLIFGLMNNLDLALTSILLFIGSDIPCTTVVYSDAEKRCSIAIRNGIIAFLTKEKENIPPAFKSTLRQYCLVFNYPYPLYITN